MGDHPSGVVPPPPGVTPDFDYSHPRLYRSNMVLISVGQVFSTMSLLLRVYTRVHILRKFETDDTSFNHPGLGVYGRHAGTVYLYEAFIHPFLSFLSMFLVLTYPPDSYKGGGVGIHIWNVTPDLFNKYQKVVLAAAVVYVPALAFAKVSMIVLYHRLMSRTTLYRWALYIISGIVCGYSISLVLALIFACNPVAKTWDVSITGGSCIDRNGVYIATAVFNIVTDLALIVLPVPVVITLQMPRIQKIGLLVLFTIGCATFVTSIVRLVALVESQKSSDATFALAWPELWIRIADWHLFGRNIESNLIIICPCLPFLRQFLRHHSPKWMGDAGSSGRYFSREYFSGSFGRSRRQRGAFILQDEVGLTDTGNSAYEPQIVKQVQWNVMEERVGGSGDKTQNPE
ncbi:hypothetical protein PHISCL_08688 [Aspergillus sclerotialis]|uniref:Rhodopsin domain-containing protein n=1 Tax=Aspergillus sclerotialis TaxID=2070753 RepID=A0A3A2Z8M9_9EURO|nr:hypothetical protein PHISCL_08688 [Aspergillus sclerotialis]